MAKITINKFPIFDFITICNNIIKFNLGNLKLLSNGNWTYIHNVEIEISEEIIINFNDPNRLIRNYWEDYEFTGNQIDYKDYELKYKNFTLIFKNFVKTSANRGKADKIIIKKGKINTTSKVNVFELINQNSLLNGTFEYGKFKINIDSIENQKIKEKYNAEYSLSYECKYNEVENWKDFIWKVYLMLRFYTGNLLSPQTKIISDDYSNFEMTFNGFESFGERDSIFYDKYNSFSEFLKTSFEIFNENWNFYNLLFTYWTNLEDKRFMEIRNLSGFVLFELLVKHLLPPNNGEFPDKLYHLFISQNFDLKFFNELFFNEFTDKLQTISEIYLQKCPNIELASEIFEFYETNFIFYYIQHYRNKIVHDGEIDFEENAVPKILNKIHDKRRNMYLDEYELPKKTLSDFNEEHEDIEGTYWEGFRKGFKIGNELKTCYSEEYEEHIRPLLTDINKTLIEYFKEHIINLMTPLEAFDNIITIFLIKLLKIDCTVPNEPKFNIEGKYIDNSKEYISKFIK